MKFSACMLNNSLFRTVLLISLVLISFEYKAQLWSEDFEGATPYAGVDTNTTDQSAVGSAGTNLWIINNKFTGGSVGGLTVAATPAQPAGIATPNGNYLHITSRAGLAVPAPTGPISNAHFNNLTTPNGESYFASINTALSTTGQTGVTMSFWFLNASPAASAEVYVKDGAAGTWTLLPAGSLSTALGGVNTAWTQVTYSGGLLDNKANIHLGFKFIAQTTGTHPSFAVDDIKINAAVAVTATITDPSPLPDTVCPGTVITLKADSSNPAITSYKWGFSGANNGPQIVFGKSVNLTAANNPGSYNINLEVSDGTNTNQTSFTLVIDTCTPPTINISGTPKTVCKGFNVTFTDATTQGYATAPILSREWTFAGGLPFSSTSTTPVVTYANTGTYDVYYKVTDKNGTYLDTLKNYIKVVNCPIPIANFTASDTIICPGTCINFFDNSQNMVGSGLTWLWEFPGSDSATSAQQSPQNICYQTPGKYKVTLTVNNANGSDVITKTEYIRVDSCLKPVVNFRAEEVKVCKNTCIQFFSSTTNADSLVWILDGIDGNDTIINDGSPKVCYSDTGKFNVTQLAINKYGADVELKPKFISVKDYPQVMGSEDTMVYIGKSVKIFAFGTDRTFKWEPDYEISCIDCRETYVSPKENTVYYVTNINDHGCAKTDSIIVRVRKEYYKGVPDIFSPNDDGVNDILYVYGNGITELEFYIYDRSGKKVFESRSQELGWDGKFNGEPVNAGVFIYFAKITHLNGYQEIIKGDVTLVR